MKSELTNNEDSSSNIWFLFSMSSKRDILALCCSIHGESPKRDMMANSLTLLDTEKRTSFLSKVRNKRIMAFFTIYLGQMFHKSLQIM